MRTTFDRTRGTDLADVRRENLHRVLEVVRTEPGSSQNDISARTGLGVAAVSSLVNELLDAEVLEEAESSAPQGRGRPKRAVRLSGRWADVVGVSITRTLITARASALSGAPIGAASQSFSAPPTPDEAMDAAARLIAAAVGDAGRGSRGPRIVVAVPGAWASTGFGGIELDWQHVDFSPLSRALIDRGLPEPLVGNDGSLATFVEGREGAAADFSNAVVLFLGRGLGGSAVIDDALLRGAATAPGFGHTSLDPDGALCACGQRGCAELTVSLTQFAAKLEETDDLDGSQPAEYARRLAERAGDGEPRVLDVLAEAQATLAHLGAIVVSLLNPEIVVLSGPGAPLAPWLLPEAVGGMLPVPTARGRFDDDTAVLGALAAAQELFLSDPLDTRAGSPAEWS
ncbi:ROK family transcriptional regulator [Microbacterium jejuense]|uniref:ROK family transcriptional regulator n=1 Tax=Microbacterium jejuense TaxID=1263637 RepID=UPI0031ECCCD9